VGQRAQTRTVSARAGSARSGAARVPKSCKHAGVETHDRAVPQPRQVERRLVRGRRGDDRSVMGQSDDWLISDGACPTRSLGQTVGPSAAGTVPAFSELGTAAVSVAVEGCRRAGGPFRILSAGLSLLESRLPLTRSPSLAGGE
jgi:hypothetical protein